MPNIPWDLLTNKLGKFLQLSYISAVIAGACLIGELIVRARSDSPAQRRQSVVTGISKVIHSHINVIIVVLLVVAAVLAAYIVGATVRFITGTIWSFTINWFFRLLSLTDYLSWWRSGRDKFLKKFAAPKSAEPYTDGHHRWIRYGRPPDKRKYDLKRPIGVLAYLWDMSHRMYPQGKELWETVTYVYGEEHVISALAGHPIGTPIQDQNQVRSLAEYCRLWLNKYAPDMAVTLSQTGRLIAFTFLIPVLLLPGSLRLVSYDTYARGGWHFIWLVVVLFFLYLIIIPGRRDRAIFELFFRFITVQLIEQSRNESKSTQQSEFREALTKATEQLSADRLDVRISSIYSMERIARESARDHPTVMKALATFVREPWRFPQAHNNVPVSERSTSPDIQAALTVIGRRNALYDQQPIDLSYARLSRVDLASANLAYADLAYADLTDADLISANLTGATLFQARLDRARLAHADLSRATLQQALLYNADLTDANLQHADLTGAVLDSADVTGANFTGGGSPGIYPVPEGWALDTESGRLKRDD
jgi:Pentapeptide repeats (8 copies)